MKKFLTATLLFVVLSAGCAADLSAQHAGVVNLNDDDFDNGIKSGYVLVDFWAAWCPPCKMLSPVIEEIAYDLRDYVSVAKVNVDLAPKVNKRFEIKAIPTLILFKDGVVLKRWTGYRSKEELTTLLEKEIR